MPKTTFVSSADSTYFPMLAEWVHSLRRFPQSKGMDICILDSGLKDAQVNQLKDMGCIVKKADWPFPIPESKIKGREFLKSCVCRPFLPDYFPDYEVFFWMDADTWVQSWEGVDMFLRGGETKKITLTAQVDRAYPRQIRMSWLGPLPVKLRGFYFSNARKAFDFSTAKALYPYHVLLAGAFVLHRDSPHWKRWQQLVQKAAAKGNIFTAEQLSLGVLCYLENYPKEILPGWTHWLCQYKPLWDSARSCFVEPYIPNEKIGILHLSGWDAMRVNRAVTTDFTTLEGGKVQLSYRYPFFNGESDLLGAAA